MDANADLFLSLTEQTAIQVDSEGGYVEIMQLLLSAGADVNAKNIFGQTALHIASYFSAENAIKVLLDADAHIDAEVDGITALHMAVFRGHNAAVQMLLNAKEGILPPTVLHVAADTGNVETLSLLLQEKRLVDLSAKDSYGCSVLHTGSASGHLNVVKMLLAAGADVLSKGEDGCTALKHASNNGHLQVVETLLQAKADIEAPAGPDNRTPLISSSLQGHVAVVNALLNAKANLAAHTDGGWTALHCAASYGHMEVVKLLLEAKADLALQTSDGKTPLHVAVREGRTLVVEALLEAKASVNAVNHAGQTALCIASEMGSLEVLKLLLEAGAEVAVKDGQGWSPYIEPLHKVIWRWRICCWRLGQTCDHKQRKELLHYILQLMRRWQQSYSKQDQIYSRRTKMAGPPCMNPPIMDVAM